METSRNSIGVLIASVRNYISAFVDDAREGAGRDARIVWLRKMTGGDGASGSFEWASVLPDNEAFRGGIVGPTTALP